MQFRKLILVHFFILFSCCFWGINISKASIDSDTIQTQFYLYPTPTDLVQIVDSESFSFDRRLLIPIENRDYYKLSESKYLILGMYLVDLAYCAFYKKAKLSLEYINVINDLTYELLISPELRIRMREDLATNIDDLEKIYMLTNQYYYLITKELFEIGRQNVVYAITVGAYIESFFLVLEKCKTFSKNNIMINKVLEQKYSIQNLNLFCNRLKEDKDVVRTLKFLNELNEIFYSFKEKPGSKREFVVTEEGKLRLKSEVIIEIENEQFIILKSLIEKIRNEILTQSV